MCVNMTWLKLLLLLNVLDLVVNDEMCVLEALITLNSIHPLCIAATNCNETIRTRTWWPASESIISVLKPNSPAYYHFQSSLRSEEDLTRNEANAIDRFNAIIHEFKRFTLLNNNNNNATGNYSDTNFVTSYYRTYDGSFNNLKHPQWATINHPFLRILPPNYYYNGTYGQVRKSKSGNELPNARFLSTLLFPDVNVSNVNVSLLTMQWGQLMAHDIGISPTNQIDCCNSTKYEEHCLPIIIAKDDPFFAAFNVQCINMMRTNSIEEPFGCTTFRQQICGVTHLIDLSPVYGSNASRAAALRQYQNGLLQVHLDERGREFLPLSFDPTIECAATDICFRAGDKRVNQNTQLTCLQVIMQRQHNRIARKLAVINPNWSDDKLYQESRTIMIAIFQHISYNDWLPFILGNVYMCNNNLYPLQNGRHSYAYRDNVNPSTINSFMAGAYRAFHSNIQGFLQMTSSSSSSSSSRCPINYLHISDWMNKPEIITKNNNLDELLIGLTTQSMQATDRYFTTQMTQLLFHGHLPYGEDLESFDIQRGRDHGLPTYNDIRELCLLKRAANFSDLNNDMQTHHVELLERGYEHVDDIDYFVGGMLETPIWDASVGPTFLCIIGEQFVRKKIGDRFWYENGGMPHSFSNEQLQEIRKASLSRLLCDNGDNITMMQFNAFATIDNVKNPLVNCSRIPFINLTVWKEN